MEDSTARRGADINLLAGLARGAGRRGARRHKSTAPLETLTSLRFKRGKKKEEEKVGAGFISLI